MFDLLRAQHREVEAALDRLAAGLHSAAPIDASLRCAAHLILRHYQTEEDFLRRLDEWHPAMARKLRAQHAEVVEIADNWEDASAAGQSRDVLYLARRFCALAQHNIIEEERDVFPLFE